MEPLTVGIWGIVLLLLMIGLGIHVGISLGLVGFVGLWALTGNLAAGLGLLTTTPWTKTASYELSCLPMFILMGLLAYESGISQEIFNAAYKWLGRLPGGLAIATVAGNACFGAVTGSSIVSVAVFTKAAFPEMQRYKYNSEFAAGSIVAGGMLGMLIPPSVLMVVYGVITQTSIGRLLIAGIGPGLLLTVLFSIWCLAFALRNPVRAPRSIIKFTIREKLSSLKGAWGVGLLIVLVVGGIYAGLFTPTEGGGVGAFGTFIIALSLRKLNWSNFSGALRETVKTTCMIYLLIIGAQIFAKFLTLTTLPAVFSTWVVNSGMSALEMSFVFMLMYLMMGCILDSISMMLITLPIIHPAMMTLGVNPIWFAMCVIMSIECGLITPPFGLNVYTLKAVAGDQVDLDLVGAFRGAAPFLLMALLALIIMLFLPGISTWLPEHMLGG